TARDADRRGQAELEPLAREEGVRLDRAPDALGDVHRALRVGAAEHERVLVPAVAEDRVHLAHAAPEHAADLHEHLAAGEVAEAVVHGLEMIDVEEEDAEAVCLLRALLADRELARQDDVEVARVVEPGELVDERLVLAVRRTEAALEREADMLCEVGGVARVRGPEVLGARLED